MEQSGLVERVNACSADLVEVKPSTITGAGFGLFAKKQFHADERVAVYGGQMKRVDEEPPSGAYVYMFPEACLEGRLTEEQIVASKWRGTYRDPQANWKIEDTGRWINHSRENRNVFADIEGKDEDGSWVLAFFAMRPIEIGEELFFDYGPLYSFTIKH